MRKIMGEALKWACVILAVPFGLAGIFCRGVADILVDVAAGDNNPYGA